MEVGVRLFGLVQLILRLLLAPVLFIRSRMRPPPALPPLADPLLQLSATQIAARIRAKKVTSEEVVSAYVARVKQVNPLLNAVVDERYEAALEEARGVDRALAAGTAPGPEEAPFLGVPVTIKESCSLKGLSLCVGSVVRRGAVADADGAATRALRAAGAVPIAVTTTPELCVSWETDNLVTGVTNNPYDLRRSPGGSSGGEAALIAAGASPLGLGSDIAGSIRVPAHYVGIFGHKPTPGYVPLEGHVPLSEDRAFREYLVLGPMCRYAEDLRPSLEVLAGARAAPLRLRDKVDLSAIKVLFMEDVGFSLVAVPVDHEIKQRLRQAVRYLHKHFDVPVDKGPFAELADSVEMSASVFFNMKGIPDVLDNPNDPKDHRSLVAEVARSMVGAARVSTAALGFESLHRLNVFVPRAKGPFYNAMRDALRTKFLEALGDNGVFLYPTYPTAANFHREMFIKMSGVMYTMVFNVLGLPATHVPLGLNKHGLPIGVQVVAAPHNDRLCLAVAEELERGFGGWVPPPATC